MLAIGRAQRLGHLRQNTRLNTSKNRRKYAAQAVSRIERFLSFELLATLVAVVSLDGKVLYANSALEDALGTSRRQIYGLSLAACFTEPHVLEQALKGAGGNAFAALRYDAWLKRSGQAQNHEPILVHVIVTQTDQVGEIVVEMLPLEQQVKLDREERLAEQAEANKELIRNLAHEIKNPLGGIRGAAQLLEMDLQTREMREYTQVIIREADRLQTLVDSLLAPHRRPHLVGDVNIHEVCERVRSLILAEFPRGLRVVRDYDTSIPEFRGDREQLIQTVLNIAHNACQALADQMGQASSPDATGATDGDLDGKTQVATVTFKTRIARQVTFGKQRYRLALELHVIDNGPGVPDSIKERIFYPLVSGRDGGSGLGLTLAQTFVQQHHGTIGVDSEPGRTDFMILIPLP